MVPNIKTVPSKLYKTFAGIGLSGYWWTYLFKMYFGAFFITDILKLPIGVYSFAVSGTAIVMLFVSPVWGAIMENGKQGKLGKLRKWMLINPAIYAIAYSLLFFKVSDNTVVLSVYICIMWFLVQLMASGSLLPLWSIHAKLGEINSEGTNYIAKRNFWTNSSKLVYSACYIGVMSYFKKISGTDTGEYFLTAALIGLLAFLFFSLEFNIMGNVEKDIDEIHGTQKKRVPILTFFKSIFSSWPLALSAISNFGFTFSITLRATLFVYYYTHVIENPELYAIHIAIASVMGVAAALSVPLLTKKIENRMIVVLTYSIEALCCIGMWAFAIKSPVIFIAFAMFFEYLSIINGTVVDAVVIDSAIYSEWKTGVNCTTTFVGGLMTLDSIASLLSSSLIGIILTRVGYKAGVVVTDTIKSGIVGAITWAPFVVCVIAGLSTLINPLNKKKLEQMKMEIAQRKLHGEQ